jgi:hypothetical protein
MKQKLGLSSTSKIPYAVAVCDTICCNESLQQHKLLLFRTLLLSYCHLMTYFADLSPCDYFGAEHSDVLRATGWLSDTEAFRIGPTPIPVFEKLKSLLHDPWQPMVFGGVHACELCQFDGPLGYANLFVPATSCIYVCPELIVHYVAAHRYLPPQEFQDALLNCPDTRSMDFKKLLLASGGRSLVRSRS